MAEKTSASEKAEKSKNEKVAPEKPIASKIKISDKKTEALVKALVEAGKARGYLTYEEMNEELPDDFSPDNLDALLMTLDEQGIELVDEATVEAGETFEEPAKAGEEPKVSEKKRKLTALEQELESDSKRIDDPVRMYLTQMGEIPLLTRDAGNLAGQEDRDDADALPPPRAGERLLHGPGGGDPPDGGRRRPAV